MDRYVYVDILDKALKPFLGKKFPNGHKFVQDNDPKHTSKYAKQWMENNSINWFPTPPESPDLNPIGKHWIWCTRIHNSVKIKWMMRHKNLHNFPYFWVACDLFHSYQNHCKTKRLVCFVEAVNILYSVKPVDVVWMSFTEVTVMGGMWKCSACGHTSAQC